ncbi:MAG TPA: hypothetical protein VGJ26_03945 [Pirellulales bacterium]|jgi:hypothetical protein
MKANARLIACAALLASAGCGGPSSEPASPAPAAPSTSGAKPVERAPVAVAKSDPAPAAKPAADAGAGKLTSSATKRVAPPTPTNTAPSPAIVDPRPEPISPALPVDDVIAAAGIRKLSSEHLTLYTDLPSAHGVDELPALFDQAYPQWRDYFGKEPKAPWRVVGCLMGDKQKFQSVGLLPADLPPFLHGYYRSGRVWLYEQPSDYYRRHLLLHEGTHAYADAALGGCGPPWYLEGIAELLATHSLVDGKLKLNVFPARREDVPLWGRVKLVRDAIDAGHALTLVDVLDYGATAHRQAEPYGWCWALAAFLEGHQRYHERFQKLPTLVRQPDFNRQFRQLFADDWADLVDEWQVFAANLEYGYDFERTVIAFDAGWPLPAGGATVTIAADRGWQSSGYQIDAGKKYRVTAKGRFQLAKEPRPWISEPNGVSIRYSQGKPLGLLLGAVRAPAKDPQARSSLAPPFEIGLGTTVKPEHTGALYLRVNDSMAELADNAGAVEVTIAPE